MLPLFMPSSPCPATRGVRTLGTNSRGHAFAGSEVRPSRTPPQRLCITIRLTPRRAHESEEMGQFDRARHPLRSRQEGGNPSGGHGRGRRSETAPPTGGAGRHRQTTPQPRGPPSSDGGGLGRSLDTSTTRGRSWNISTKGGLRRISAPAGG